MITRSLIWIAFIALHLVASPTLAQTARETNAGGVLTAEPNCVIYREDRIHCFGRGRSNSLFHTFFDGSSWTAWTNLGGYITSKPSCVSVAGPSDLSIAIPSDEEITCFALGRDRGLWFISRTSGAFGAWSRIGGVLTSAPVCLHSAIRRELFCFGRGQDGHLYRITSTGMSFAGAGWTQTPLVVPGEADCLEDILANTIRCFALGAANELLHIGFPSGNQPPMIDSFGGVFTSLVSCTGHVTAGRSIEIWCFGRGLDQGLWGRRLFPATIPDWVSFGGVLEFGPDCTSGQFPGTMLCAGIAQNRKLCTQNTTGNVGLGWVPFPSPLADLDSRPQCIRTFIHGSTPAMTLCFALAINGSLVHLEIPDPPTPPSPSPSPC